MTNSWSLLFDELNMSNDDKLPTNNNGDSGSVNVGHPFSIENGDDYITFDHIDKLKLDLTVPKNSNYRYSENEILTELKEYITGTYNQHYSSGSDQIQTLDLIEACGDGEAFCRSNILKYASRYDKKGTSRRDIMKILHYAVLLMHFNDKNAKRETYNQ